MNKRFRLGMTLLALSANTVAWSQENPLLSGAFWKTSPSVEAVKAEMDKGHKITDFNSNSFDPTTMAINSDAPVETIKFMVEQPGIGVKRITHDSRIYLHWAASRGNVALVNWLIEKGSDINLEDSHGSTPAVFAAGAGQANVGVYEAFFKGGLDAKKKYRDGANLLLLGVANDSALQLTNYFISKGMSLQSTDDFGNTAFNYAARAGKLASLQLLKSKKIKYNDYALIMAAEGSRRGAAGKDVFDYLVDDLKLKPTVTSREGQTLLHLLSRRPGQLDLVNYFLSKGVNANQTDQEGNTALMVAAGGRDKALVELLLAQTKNVNAANKNGETALTRAVGSGSPEVVDLLLKNKADIAVKDKDGNTLANYLIQSYRPQSGRPGSGGEQRDEFGAKLALLQAQNLDFKAPQKDGNSLFHVALAKNDLALLKTIHSLQVDVNARNKNGETVLHKAAMTSKNDAVLKYLVEIGASKTIKTELDETAYDLAKENDYLSRNNVSVDFLK